MRNAEDMEELDAYYRDEEPPPRACPECGDDDRHAPDCSRNYKNMSPPEQSHSVGYCPVCSKPLTALTIAAKGYCEIHGWQWADWTPLTAGETLHPDVRKRWERTP